MSNETTTPTAPARADSPALTGYAPVEQPKTMKLQIAISKLNESGSLARLENDDMDSVDFCISNTSQDAKKLCLKAAKELREYAARFEMLANEPDPFKEATQNRVNRAKVEAHSGGAKASGA